MTDLLARPPRAHHADGLAIFDATIAHLLDVGSSRPRVGTLVRDDHLHQVRHQFSAGCWELHFELRPNWERLDQRARTSVNATAGKRSAVIDLSKPLPSGKAVLSELFGTWHAVCAHAVPAD